MESANHSNKEKIMCKQRCFKRILAIFFLSIAVFCSVPSLNAEEVPSFSYIDIELFSAVIASEYAFNSALYFDWCSGSFLIHLGLSGGYGPVQFIGYEAGFSYILSGKYEKNIETMQLVNIKTETKYYGEETSMVFSSTYSDFVTLHLLDLGIKGFFEMYFQDNYPEWNEEVFGEMYNEVTEVEYYTYDKIFYFGYKYSVIGHKILTTSEIIVYVHGLLGIVDRKADIWDNSITDTPAYSPTKSGVAWGFEAGLRYGMTQFTLGYYDSHFIFTAGFRFPFEIGF